MNNLYKFTVFTPCYNSEKFIHRVYNSLINQTFKDFEWLVIDDASTDNTLSILNLYKKENKINIKLIVNEVNKMTTKNYNIAFSMAMGELFVPLGHDDAIREDTLEVLNSIWENHKTDKISGIWSMVKDQNGNLIGKEFKSDILIDNFFNIFLENIYTKEKFTCIRTDILKNTPYENNGMNYISEGSLWGRINLYYDTIFTNEVFRTYYIEQDNLAALTKRSREQIAESTMYDNILWINDFFPRINDGLFFKLRKYFSFAFYSLFNVSKIFENFKLVRKIRDRIIILFFYPLAILVYPVLKIKSRS